MDHQYQYLILLLIPLGTIWGNVFVCLAVYLERRLRHRFNLFLVSLAISDLLCATIVMPMSVLKMITENETESFTAQSHVQSDPPWYGKKEVCLTWYSLDIFFTATTIIHLCTISLDRYLALRSPLQRDQILPKCLEKLALRIFMCWFVPFAIAGPLFAFQLMHKEEHISDVTTPIGQTSSYKGCGPNEVPFVFTAIGITFVLPLIIMAVTYVLTVRSLQQHMRQAKALNLYANSKKPHITNVPLKRLDSSRSNKLTRNTNSLDRSTIAQTQLTEQQTTTEKRKQSNGVELRTDTQTLSGQSFDQNGHNQKEKAKNKIGCSMLKKEITIDQTSGISTDTEAELIKNDCRLSSPMAYSSSGIVQESEYETLNEKNDPSINRRDNTLQPRSRITKIMSKTAMDQIHSGRRAVRVIGVLFSLFVTCYLPFFIVYAINAVLRDPNHWTGKASAHLEWLGYTSSMLNPVVYHAFNPTFRRTFRRILRCTCARTSYVENPSTRESKRI